MKKNILNTIASSAFLIIIWFIISITINSEIILPSPFSVLKSTLQLFLKKEFTTDILSTVLRAFESFFIVVFLGTVFGILAGNYKIIDTMLSPVISIFKATPIISVILILFIWLRTNAIPVFSAFLMAFPIMYVQILDSYRAIDPKLKQMCHIYKIEGKRKLSYLIIPSLIPSLITGSKQTLSMIWKVVIASEVLTLPKNGIGRSMQLSQIQLETSNVLAWTVVTIVITSLSNWIFNIITSKITKGRFFYES